MSLMASLVTTSRMQQCFNVLIDIYHEFLLLFYCCVLLEIKLTTTITCVIGVGWDVSMFPMDCWQPLLPWILAYLSINNISGIITWWWCFSPGFDGFIPAFDGFIPAFDRSIPAFDRSIPASIPITGQPPPKLHNTQIWQKKKKKFFLSHPWYGQERIFTQDT